MIQEKQVNHPLPPEQKKEQRCCKRIQKIKKYTSSGLEKIQLYKLKKLQKEAEELQLTKQCKEIQQAIIHKEDVFNRSLRSVEFYEKKSTSELEELILQYESFSDPQLKGHINAMRLMISFRKKQQQKLTKQKENNLLRFFQKNFWSPFLKAVSPSNFGQEKIQKQGLEQFEEQKEKNQAFNKQQ